MSFVVEGVVAPSQVQSTCVSGLHAPGSPWLVVVVDCLGRRPIGSLVEVFRSPIGSLVEVDVGLVGPPWSSLDDGYGLRMALGSILGHERPGVVRSVATWSCLLTYVCVVLLLGSTGWLELDERAMQGCMVLVFVGSNDRIVVTETTRNTGLLAVSCMLGYILTPWMCRRIVEQIWVFCWGTWSSLQEIW